jgi:hypothetical protein
MSRRLAYECTTAYLLQLKRYLTRFLASLVDASRAMSNDLIKLCRFPVSSTCGLLISISSLRVFGAIFNGGNRGRERHLEYRSSWTATALENFSLITLVSALV